MRKSLSGTSFSKTLSGLTLIELIFVVALIAILLALLMPALKSARDQVRAIQCLNNVRQIGQAQFVFADDNDGKFARYRDSLSPTADDLMCKEITDSHYWHECLRKYLGGTWSTVNYLPAFTGKNEIGMCPGNRNGEAWASTHWNWPGGHLLMFGYASNLTLLGDFSNLGTGQAGLSLSLRISQIERPAAKPMFGCTYISGEWGGITADKSANFGYVHRGAANFVFVDGHAERKTQAELDAIPGWRSPSP